MEENVQFSIGGYRANFRLHPFLVAAAAALTLAYTIIGWNDPTLGLHKTFLKQGNDFGLAIAVVVVNSLVALVALSNIGSIADLSASGKGVGINVGLSLAAAVLMGAAAVSIANATTVRRKRGDALGISAVVLSSLSLLPSLVFLLGGTQNVIGALLKL